MVLERNPNNTSTHQITSIIGEKSNKPRLKLENIKLRMWEALKDTGKLPIGNTWKLTLIKLIN